MFYICAVYTVTTNKMGLFKLIKIKCKIPFFQSSSHISRADVAIGYDTGQCGVRESV